MIDTKFEQNLTNSEDEHTAIISHINGIDIDYSHELVTINVTKENMENKTLTDSNFVFEL